jgi:hypothetical protein
MLKHRTRYSTIVLMTFIRRVLYHSTGALHKLALLLLPLVFAVAVLASSPKYIEHALKQSRVYDQVVATVIDNSQKESDSKDTQQILADPGIKAAAQKSFTPSLLQSSAENVINGVFAWMQGKTAEPQFRIDLTNAKAELSKNVAAYAEKRANSLPTCTIQQLRQLNPNIDLLQIPCLPPGANVSALASQYSQKFLSDGDFLKDPVITNETIAKNNDGKPLSEQLSAVPKAYSALMIAKWALLALALLLTALLIFARRNRKAGLLHVAWTFIGVATFLLIVLTIYWFVFAHAHSNQAATDMTQAMWMDGAQSLMRDFNKVIILFSVGYLALGAGALTYLRFRFAPSPKSLANEPVVKDGSTEINPPADNK